MGQHDAVGIDELAALLGGGPVRRGAHFDGAAVIDIHRPVGDVHLVGAPVGNRSTAKFPGPAPSREIFGRADGAEGGVVVDERAGAAPAGPVEAGRQGLGGEVVGNRRSPEMDVDGVDAPEHTVAHEFDGGAELRRGALLGTGLEHTFGVAHGLHHGDGLVDIVGQRFFAIHILARAHGGDGDEGVPVVGRGDEHRVDVGAREQLAKIIVGGAALVSGARGGE